MLLMDAGMDKIERHERAMTRRLLESFRRVEGLEIIGEPDIDKVDRGPVVSIALKGTEAAWKGDYIPPAFVGTALSLFYGIGTRVGFYCAHPYGYFMRQAAPEAVHEHALRHMEKRIPGCVLLPGDEKIYTTRFSFSFAVTEHCLDGLPDVLTAIRDLSYNNCVIKPDFAHSRWVVDGPGYPAPAKFFNLAARRPVGLR